MSNSLQVAGYLRRGTPQRIGAKTTLGAAPAPASPGHGRNAEPTHGNASPWKLCGSRERPARIEVMGCRGASLNGWPGTQGTARHPTSAEMPVEQLGLRAAIVNCCDGWRKLVPAFVGIEQPSRIQQGLSRELLPVVKAYRAQGPQAWGALCSRLEADAPDHRSCLRHRDPPQRERADPRGVACNAGAAGRSSLRMRQAKHD